MLKLFLEGGVFGMTLLTLIFIALFLAAWKAPAWVKETGLIGLVWGNIYTFLGFMQAMGAIAKIGEVSPILIYGSLRVVMVPLVYGMIIYLASLIIRIVQKSRI